MDTNGRKERRKRGSTLAPTPSDSWRSASTCLSSEQAVEEAPLGRRVGPVHVQVRAQRPVRLVDVDLFEALHLDHLWRTRGPGQHRGKYRASTPSLHNFNDSMCSHLRAATPTSARL